MHLDKIIAFSFFLAGQPKSYSEIAKYLVMNTFSEESFLTINMGELTETGVVRVLGGFGWDATEYAAFTELPIQAKFPVTDAIRANEVIVFKQIDIRNDYPLMTENKTSVEWVSGVAIPVYPIGGMTLYSTKELISSAAMKVFLISIGSLLGLYLNGLPFSLAEAAIHARNNIDLPPIPLSDRQLVIAELLRRGFNNARIAEEIGFSVSLIRQESVAIYKKLQVTGRKAMQEIRSLNLEAAAISEQVSRKSEAGPTS